MTLSGRLTDPTGAPLPGVQLQFSGGDTEITEYTDPTGRYTFGEVPAGRYVLRLEVAVDVGAGEGDLTVGVAIRPGGSE